MRGASLLGLFAALVLGACAGPESDAAATEQAATSAGDLRVGDAPVVLEDFTEDQANARIRPQLARAFALMAPTDAGRWLAGRLGAEPITLSLTDAYSVVIHVESGTRTISANPTLFDRLPIETLTAVLAHELEHVAQHQIPGQPRLFNTAEFAALSVEHQVWRALPSRPADPSPEASRLVAYEHYPSATLQLWRASKYSWAHEPLPPPASWSAEERAYWAEILEREARFRGAHPAGEPDEAAWRAIDAWIESRSHGDNWSESGFEGSRIVGRAFFADLDRLGSAEAGTAHRPEVASDAERFVLQWSYAGTYDEASASFTVTNPILRP